MVMMTSIKKLYFVCLIQICFWSVILERTFQNINVRLWFHMLQTSMDTRMKSVAPPRWFWILFSEFSFKLSKQQTVPFLIQVFGFMEWSGSLQSMVNQKSIVEHREFVACNMQLANLKPKKWLVNCQKIEITSYKYSTQFSRQTHKIRMSHSTQYHKENVTNFWHKNDLIWKESPIAVVPD